VVKNKQTANETKMSSQVLRDYINRHLGSTTVLAALGVVLDAQLTATPLQPALQGQIEEVLDAVGCSDATKPTRCHRSTNCRPSNAKLARYASHNGPMASQKEASIWTSSALIAMRNAPRRHFVRGSALASIMSKQLSIEQDALTA
jgi:hypothetical protein